MDDLIERLTTGWRQFWCQHDSRMTTHTPYGNTLHTKTECTDCGKRVLPHDPESVAQESYRIYGEMMKVHCPESQEGNEMSVEEHEAAAAWMSRYYAMKDRFEKAELESRELEAENTELAAQVAALTEALEDIVKRNEIQHWFNLDKARQALADLPMPPYEIAATIEARGKDDA